MEKCVGAGILHEDEVCENGKKLASFVLYPSSSNKEEGQAELA